MELIEQVSKKMEKDDLSMNKFGYLLGFSQAYICKLLHGKRRITKNVEVKFKDYVDGKYDGIEIPRHTVDREQKIYLQGYRQAIKDMKEFIDTKKD